MRKKKKKSRETKRGYVYTVDVLDAKGDITFPERKKDN